MQFKPLTKLRKYELEGLRKAILKELKTRYYRRKETKYGTLNRGLTEQELQKLLTCFTSTKARTICELMYAFGLRSGEACSQRIKDIDFTQRRLWVSNPEKGSHSGMYYLFENIYHILFNYYQQNKRAIHATGYFFPGKEQHNKYAHASPNWLRNQFRIARAQANIGIRYGQSTEQDPWRTPRTLNTCTTHSLRHTFGQQFDAANKDLILLQRALRHKNIKNTMIYTFKKQEELDQGMTRLYHLRQTL